jgi:uncharacterized surface protein with fasciclin (FAS1) repeats
MFRRALFLAATALCLASAQNETAVESTIDGIIMANADGDLTSLGRAFQTSGLVGVLCTNCNYTVFAPVDSAFESMDQDRLLELLTDRSYISHLQQLLALHATYPTADRIYSIDFVNGGMMFQTQTSNMENLTVSLNGDEIAISTSDTQASLIIDADNIAMNGNIHKLNQVLLPEWWDVVDLKDLPGSSAFSLMFELFNVAKINLGENVTVLAPTNDAFLVVGEETLEEWREGNNLEELQSVLSNHIINQLYPSLFIENGTVANTDGGSSTITFTKSTSDGKITVNGANVIQADVLAAHAIIHVIDQVIMPSNVTTLPTPGTTTPKPPTSSLPMKKVMLSKLRVLWFCASFSYSAFAFLFLMVKFSRNACICGGFCCRMCHILKSF